MTDRQAVRPALAAEDWDRLTEEPLPELDGEYPLSEAQVEGFWENGFIVLEGVLDRAEITAYGEAIRDVAMAHFRARGLVLSFGGAFLQQLNLRYCSDAVRNFVQSPRFGRIASHLLLRAPACTCTTSRRCSSRPAAPTRTGTRTSSILHGAPANRSDKVRGLRTALKVAAVRSGQHAKDIVAQAVRDWLPAREDEELQAGLAESRREWERDGGREAGEFSARQACRPHNRVGPESSTR